MKKVTQTIKQHTSVNVTTCCRFSRKKKRICKKKRFICDKICGSIIQPCDEKSRVYFRAEGICSSTSVLKIENTSDSQMKVIIEHGLKRRMCIEQEIEPFQDVCFIIGSIKKFKIKCKDCTEENKLITGNFELKVRYRKIV